VRLTAHHGKDLNLWSVEVQILHGGAEDIRSRHFS